MTSTVRAKTIAQVLSEARARLRRLSPHEAFDAMTCGALLVDIRPSEQRARQGEVPGALILERNVLEWRLDPTSDTRIPEIRDYGHEVIVMCSEGYTSSLAAVALQELGLADATDVDGGFVAWAAAALPTKRSGDG